MKRIMILATVLALFTVPSFAILHVGVSAGYAYANMDQVNNAMEDAKKAADDLGGSMEIQNFGNSIFVNGDLGIGIIPFLHIGPRVGLQYVFPATSTEKYEIGGVNFLTTESSFSAMLVPLELGVTLNLGIPLTPVSITVGGYAGYGLAFGVNEIKQTSDFGDVPDYAIPYDGGGFMADLSAAVEFNILPLINISINAGYRYALVENVNVTKEIKDPITGDVLVSADGQLPTSPYAPDDKLKVNFSGFLVGAGVNIRF